VNFELLYFAIWLTALTLSPYLAFRKKHDLLCAAVLLSLLLMIDVFMGLNRPNPDHEILIQVTIP